MRQVSLKSLPKLALVTGVAGIVALVGMTAVRAAAPQPNEQTSPATPGKWNWEIRDGKRVPKSERQTQADGSWRETTRVGACTTVKEHSAAGEYRESRRCD